jgi:hypothetical protein
VRALRKGAVAIATATAPVLARPLGIDALLGAEPHDVHLLVRCAWCERYDVGGRWQHDRPGAFDRVRAATTHGICGDCLATVALDAAHG